MARAKTTFDTFNAIAEPKRRALLERLAGREMTVNEIVDCMGWNQPVVSKHLGVLRQVGLVVERREGRYRAYRVNAVQLKPVQEWVVQFQQYWGGALTQLDEYLDQLQQQGAQDE